MKKFMLLAVILLSGVFTASAHAAGFAGVWKADINLPNNGGKITFVARLKQDGDKVTGTLDGLRGAPDVQVMDATVAGDTVTFYGIRGAAGKEMKFKYVAKTVGSDELDFTVTHADVDDPNPVHLVTKKSE